MLSRTKPLHVAFGLYDDVNILDVCGPLEAFWLAADNSGDENGRRYRLSMVSQQGGQIRTSSGMLVDTTPWAELDAIDTVIIPGGGSPHSPRVPQGMVQWITEIAPQVRRLCEVCTGAYLLAAAKQLDECQATTHWGFQDMFQTLYPKVKLHADQLISRDQHIYCAGGGLAWFDLGLHLIERYYGFELAMQSAKSFVIDYRRDSQLSYSLLKIGKPHHDELVLKVQDWLEQHFHEALNLEQLATRFNLTTRTLIRRFKQALDVPPNQYLQAIRIEAARKRLEETEQAVDLVMQHVGYHDPSSFRRLFHKKTGLTPLEYRRRFSRRF